MSNYPPIGLDDRLKFGKHGPKNGQPGKELWQVIEDDISWVTWAMANAGLQLDDEAFETYQKRLSGDPR